MAAEPMQVYPDSVPVPLLETTHPDYDAKALEEEHALYAGGKEFRRIRDRFIVRRQIETQSPSGIDGNALYAERAKCAAYVNRAGGIIDWFVAKALHRPPSIVVPPDAPEETRAFWKGLNQNADGYGTPLPHLCRQALVNMLKHRRGYFRVNFDHDEQRAGEQATATAHIIHVAAPSCDDWNHDGLNLDYVRTRSVRTRRSPFADDPAEEVCWYIYTGTHVVKYFALRDRESGAWLSVFGTPVKQDEIPEASKAWEKDHDFGMPVFEIRASIGHHVMDRIRDVAECLFNRELDLTFGLRASSYPMPVLTLNSQRENLISNELVALILEVGEEMKYVSPANTVYEPSFKDVDRLKSAFYEVVSALAKEVAALPQAGRLSGSAVAELRDPMIALLDFFTWPVEEALTRTIRALQAHRGESHLDIRLTGFDEYEATLSEFSSAIGADKSGADDDDQTDHETERNEHE